MPINGGFMVIKEVPYVVLQHHGIKGQRWGVRRGPPYPIEDKTMYKGTRLNSVSGYNNSTAYKNKKSWMYTFNPNDEWDSKVYKGPFSVYRMQYGSHKYVYEHRFEVVKDLKMPTRKERVDEFINLYNKNTKLVGKEMKQVQRMLNMYDVLSGHSKQFDPRKATTKEDFESLYEIFNHAMEHVDSFKSTKAYAEIMGQKFDAMVDDNNQGIYNGVHDPVIIFRANDALREIGSARMIDVDEIVQNYKAVGTELVKKGEQIKL